MPQPFEQLLASHWPALDWSDVTVLVGVSGGADSMALLRALRAIHADAGGQLVVGHFNHRLRGKESDEDEMFVREQCSKLETQCEVGSANEHEVPVPEDTARRARYDFFRELAKKIGARFVITAHTSDDQVETILHRILRGTGLDGLAGIPESRELMPGVSLMRPLLWASRIDVLAYLEAIEQPFREDSSNISTRFTRNRLRNELIPQLEQDYNPRVKEALLRLGEHAADAQVTITKLVDAALESRVLSLNAGEVSIRCDPYDDTDPHVLRQMLIQIWRKCGWPMRDMTSQHWRQLADLISSQAALTVRTTLPGGVNAERNGSLLVLDRS
jgi:tRNA(Ile)-lysidine synthase